MTAGRPSIPQLRFFGATGTVTGSRFLVDTPEARVLVDCGLFQGLKSLRERNWQSFPIDPASIDAILLTHAHLDHTGYLPALCRDGFRGKIICSEGTRDLSGIVLPDSGHLQEEDAAYANRKGFTRHTPALPLYTQDDAHRALEQFETVPFDVPHEVASGLRATFRSAGHILGSATITLDLEHSPKRTVVFSGDLGRPNHPLLRPPAPLVEADVVVVESTYGDRRHEDVESLQRFEDAIVRTVRRGGMVVIPAFAVDRTEVILFHLGRLARAGRIPELPVYVDSPMALDALQIYRRALTAGDPEINPQAGKANDALNPGHLIESRKVEESKAIHEQHFPSIIISASGMATGGRVLHHLAHRLPDHRNTVILVGHQAHSTRGHLLLEGARSIKMFGRYIPVRAEVVMVPAFSVHADRPEILDWLRAAPRAPSTTFVVHGEPTAAESLRGTIEAELGWNAVVPRYLERVRLD